MKDAADGLAFQLVRRQKILLKRFLEILEMNQREHKQMIERLKKAFPQEQHVFIEAVDYFTGDKFDWLRKATLDAEGDCGRDMIETLKNYTIDINFNQ